MIISESEFPGLSLLDVSAPIHSGSVELGDNPPIRWAALGEGTTLICCNGSMTSSMFWTRTAQTLARRHRVVLWDYPGHGVSGLGETVADLSIPTLARYVERIRDQLGAPRVVLLGHSMGCQVALEAGRLFPDRVSGLVLVAPTVGRLRDHHLYGLPMPLLLTILSAAARLTPPGKPTPFERMSRSAAICRAVLRLHLMHPRLIDPRHMDAYVAHLVALNAQVVSRIVAEADRHDALQFLGAIRCPTLIVAGDRDPVVSYRFSERLSAAMPNARVRPVIGATHALPIEFPAFMTRYIEDFLGGELQAGAVRASEGGARVPRQQIGMLLMELFTHEELTLWVRARPGGDEILRSVPIGCSYATMVDSVVEAHRARGLLDQEFFERLMRVRPRREAEIYEVSKSFGLG